MIKTYQIRGVSLPVLLMILFFCSNPSFGQVKSYLRAGINYSTIEAKDLDRIEGIDIRKPLLHVHAGFSLEWMLGRNFSLMGGVYYSIKGYRDFNETHTIIHPKDLHIQYIATPFTLNYSVGRCWFAGMGLEFNYRLNKFYPFVRESGETGDFQASDKHDLGGIVVFRYQLKPMEVGLTTYVGLLKIIDIHDNGIERYYKSRNLQVHIAYFFQSE